MKGGSDHDIAVVIVNYNSALLTLRAVESVFAMTADMARVNVHIVDNASPEGDADTLREAIEARGWRDRVTLYAEARNHGFGRGNNVALTALAALTTRPSRVLCLNPDARLRNDVIAHLSSRLDAHPDVAIVGGAMTDENGDVAAAAFRFPHLAGLFGYAVNFRPISRWFARWRTPIEPAPQTECEVDWVTGAVFMARFDAIESAGFFDPNYFLYFEEVDLMRAVRAKGWRILHAPQAVVEHIGGAVTEQTGERGPQLIALGTQGCEQGIGSPGIHCQLREVEVHQAVSLNSSRPMSMRRISDVPAPISYSFASRSSRPVGYSLI